jgi:ATP-dependent RNA helicase DeaD
MSELRKGAIHLLVATDVVGRGIDVTGLSHIINFDIPQYCDDYVHRVGRTGRMGREGVAYTLVSPDQGTELTRIEMRIDTLLKPAEMPGMTLVSEPVVSDEVELDPVQQREADEKRAVQSRLGRGGKSGRYRRGL